MKLDPMPDPSFDRLLPVSRPVVWACWTQPSHITQFLVPRRNKAKSCDIALPVGGRSNNTFDVDGNLIELHGVDLEIYDQEKLLFSESYAEG